MRSHRLFAALVGVVVLATGSAHAAASPQPDGSTTPQRGGVLMLALSEDPPSLNPNLSTHPDMLNVSPLWAEGLVDLDSSSQPVPQLAESWEVSEDGLEYTFHLRQGVTWHDGEPFTADDVVWTLNETMEFIPTASRFIEYVDGAEKVDDHTVILRLTEPYAAILVGLSRAVTVILPAHLYEGTDIQNNPANVAPVGTGPYKFASWERGQRITFEANPDYWNPDEPNFDTATFQVLGDDSARIAGLRSGELHWSPTDELPAAQLASLAEDPNLVRLDNVGDIGTVLMMFNMDEGRPTADLGVRQALAMVIDKQQILDNAFQGEGAVAETVIPPGFGDLSSEQTYAETYPHDVERANELLDEAGFAESDGNRMTLDIVLNTGPEFTAMANVLQSQLAEVGIELTISQHDSESRNHRIFTERSFDLYVTSYTSFLDPALGIHRVYTCAQVGQENGNGSGYCNEELEAAFTAADSARDIEARSAAYDDVTSIVIEDIPSLAILFRQDSIVASARIQNLEEQWSIGAGRVDWAVAYFDG